MRFRSINVKIVKQRVWGDWENANNLDYASNGIIWIGWNNKSLRVTVKEVDVQWIHCEVCLNKENTQAFVTIAYDFNQPMKWKSLWRNIT